MTHALEPLFAPRSAALVGASPDYARYGGRVWRFLRGFGFAGGLWPINPKYEEIAGERCFPDLASLPEPPEHVGIAVAPDRIPGVLDECARLGVRAATIFSAGFAELSEAGGVHQQELTTFARAQGIRLLGPNCNGVINWRGRFAMTASATVNEPMGRAGGVGVVSQSGGLGQVNVMWRAIRAGLGISCQASCGNEADIDAWEVADYLIADPDTRIVLMAIEGIRDGAMVHRAAERAHAAGKPILVLKLGRSDHGRRAVQSHTGAITGADATHDSALEQLGILRVEDAQHLWQAALLFDQGRRPTSSGVASLSTSGGGLALLADQAERFGLSFPAYAPATRAALAEEIPGFINLGNPTDLSVDLMGQPERLGRVIGALAGDPAIGLVLPMLTTVPTPDRDLFFDFARRAEKPAALIWTGGCTDGPFPEQDGLVDGVPVYRDIDTAMRAAGLLVRHAALLDRFAKRVPPVRPSTCSVERARALVAGAPDQNMSERASGAVLAAYGIATPRSGLATSPEDAQRLVRQFGRAALKIESPDIAHKSDCGGVVLDVDGAGAAGAYEAILRNVGTAHPSARRNGVLVQEMLAPGVELILGMTIDPTWGPVVALGMGGVFVEFSGQPVLRLPPVSEDEAHAMIDALAQRRLLDGVRGRPAAAIDVLAGTIVRFSWLAADLATGVREMDINPLIVGPKTAIATDALIVRA